MKKTDNVIRFDWAAKNILRDKASFVILEGFLSALLKEKVTIIELLESESNRQRRTAKANRVDVKAKNSKEEIFLIEIQQTSETDYLERIVFSAAKTITDHIDSGINYAGIKKVFSVNIVYFNLGEGNDYLYHGQSILRGVNTGDTLLMTGKNSQGLRMVNPKSVFPEYYILRVKKFNDENPSTALDEWMRYFKWGYIDPDTKVPGLREAMKQLNVLNLSEKDRQRYEYDLYGCLNRVLTPTLSRLSQGVRVRCPGNKGRVGVCFFIILQGLTVADAKHPATGGGEDGIGSCGVPFLSLAITHIHIGSTLHQTGKLKAAALTVDDQVGMARP